MEQIKNMENSFHVMSHEELADVEGGLLFGLVVVGGVAIAGTWQGAATCAAGGAILGGVAYAATCWW